MIRSFKLPSLIISEIDVLSQCGCSLCLLASHTDDFAPEDQKFVFELCGYDRDKQRAIGMAQLVGSEWVRGLINGDDVFIH